MADSRFQLGDKVRIIKNAEQGLEEGIIIPKPWWFNNAKGYSHFVEVAPMLVAGCYSDELTEAKICGKGGKMLTKETDIYKKVSAYHHYDVVHGVSKYWTCASLCGLVIERRWIVRDDDEPISCKLCLRILGRGGYSGSGKLEEN